MSGPFVSLGLKGANKMIDKHFDKIPHKYLYSDTYKPHGVLKNNHHYERDQARRAQQENDHNQSDDEEDGYEYDSQEEEQRQETQSVQSRGRPRRPRTVIELSPESDTEDALQSKNKNRELILGRNNMSPMPKDGSLPGGAYSQESPYITPPFPMYSHEPSHSRPQYMPASPTPPLGVVGGYYPPPPAQNFASPQHERRNRGRENRRDSWDDEDEYYSDHYRKSARPTQPRRRSSSYHGPRGRGRDSGDEEEDYGAIVARRGKTPSGSQHVDHARETAHRYGVKDELEHAFTKSKAGLGGAAVGAVVAGWAANKAQVGYTRDGGRRSPNALVTLLGAAVGGLAVNAAVEKYEEGKGVAKDQERKWDEKWDRDRDGGRSQVGRSEGGGRRRDRGGERDRGYGSDGGRSHRRDRRRDSAYGGSDGYD